jgi:hypothetical protein
MKITVQTYQGQETIKATGIGLFAVHKNLTTNPHKKGWTITHLQSGRRMPRTFRYKLDALKIARGLMNVTGWDSIPKEIPQDGFKTIEMTDALRKLQDDVKAVYESIPHSVVC